jgi:glycosyltransferase involved in cell wall biosynthesis
MSANALDYDQVQPTPVAGTPRLAILCSFSGAGGVERMVMNLVEEFDRLGRSVDLLVIRAESAHLDKVPATVNVINLHARHTLTAIPALVHYLRRMRPAALLAAKDRAGRAALWARRLSGVKTRVVIRLGTNLSAALQGKWAIQRWARYWPMRLSYVAADAVIAVSRGVADDTCRITGLSPERIHVIRNPVVTPRLVELASAPAPHPWLGVATVPLILGAGRLTRQKDFQTLVRAFARLRSRIPARLIVLGEGTDRAQLEALAKHLGVADDVSLPGFTANPYAFMARADLFVLSSRWEGSPNVLTEAMALGTAVVATDCPSGPREILQAGAVAPLVPVGEEDALAEAMTATLANPPDPARLQAAVEDYRVERSAAEYLRVLGR